MINVPGFKKKNKKGKTTHVKLSTKHYADLIEDIILHAQLVKARKGKLIDWEKARNKISKKIKL